MAAPSAYNLVMDESRSTTLRVRLSIEERAQLRARARAAHMPISTYVRSVALCAAERDTGYGSEAWISERIAEAEGAPS